MPKTFIRDLKEGSSVDSFFLCGHKALLFGKNNKSYINLRLLDRTGVVEARVWDNAESLAQNFERHDYVRVKGRVVFYQDHLQLNVFEIQSIDVTRENLDPGDFLPKTKKDIPKMYEEVLSLCRDQMQNPWIRRLMLNILEDPKIREPLFLSPAAKTNHHAWVGGLLEHVLQLCKIAQSLLQHYPQINLDLVLAGMILHDIGKIEEIDPDRLFAYTDKGRLVGHLIIGVEILIRKTAEIPNFPEKILQHLEHIVLSHHGRLEYGSPKRPKTLEALVVSYLDDLDSKIQGFEDLVARDPEGDPHWTPYNQLFERPLYKHTQKDLEESVRLAEGSPISPTMAEEKTEKKKPRRHSDPLVSNLGDLLQHTVKK
jgi:3'-5' exoribonuclease